MLCKLYPSHASIEVLDFMEQLQQAGWGAGAGCFWLLGAGAA